MGDLVVQIWAFLICTLICDWFHVPRLQDVFREVAAGGGVGHPVNIALKGRCINSVEVQILPCRDTSSS